VALELGLDEGGVAGLGEEVVAFFFVLRNEAEGECVVGCLAFEWARGAGCGGPEQVDGFGL
jgi:hypothetical protein